ncbi:hypothetical protein ALC53_04657 [Atta colombica]|uniref:Uncharacterized protein n=1 Tax=Atta colombica TaxID=520822 RepID=A0A195BKW8_9HYME|nr:hypothetical protein ALC53_04657 [Atta colombica]
MLETVFNYVWIQIKLKRLKLIEIEDIQSFDRFAVICTSVCAVSDANGIDFNRELICNKSCLCARILRNSLERDEYCGVEGKVKSSLETFKAARERRDRNSAYFTENRIARNCPSERSSSSPFRIFRDDCKGHYPAICDSSHAGIDQLLLSGNFFHETFSQRITR